MSKQAQLYNVLLDDAQQLINMAIVKVSRAKSILGEDFGAVKAKEPIAAQISDDLSRLSQKIDELPVLEQS